MPLTIKQISDALDLSRSRVEQWISRGYFRTPDVPILGKARDWDIQDAMRLAIMSELVDAGLSPEQAGQLVWAPISGFMSDHAFFVAWQGAHDMAVYPNGEESEPAKMYMPGAWFQQILRGGRLFEFLSNPDVAIATVISLDNLERRVKQALNYEVPESE